MVKIVLGGKNYGLNNLSWKFIGVIMNVKFLKISLLYVKFEKFTFINEEDD